MDFASRKLCALKAQSYLDALYRLHAHKRTAKQSVEFFGIAHTAAEPAFKTFDAYFYKSARRVALGFQSVDNLHRLLLGVLVEHKKPVLLCAFKLFEGIDVFVPDPAYAFDVARNFHTEQS